MNPRCFDTMRLLLAVARATVTTHPAEGRAQPDHHSSLRAALA
jgi:hypothetical protein